jgi:hypothetical protein
MMPTVAQQLAGIRNTMTKVVIPGLDPKDPFAQEQAGLIVATLNWILDVQGSEYLYEAVENTEYRRLLPRLAETATKEAVADRAFALREIAAEPGAVTDDLPTLDALRSHTRLCKEFLDDFYAALVSVDDPGAAQARELILFAAQSQARRDQAWFRMTGFPKEAEGDIATVLATSAKVGVS